jgi:hypothetical protein
VESQETNDESIQDGGAEVEAEVAAVAAGAGCGGVVSPPTVVECPLALAFALRASCARLCAASITGLGPARFFFGFAASATIL